MDAYTLLLSIPNISIRIYLAYFLPFRFRGEKTLRTTSAVKRVEALALAWTRTPVWPEGTVCP